MDGTYNTPSLNPPLIVGEVKDTLTRVKKFRPVGKLQKIGGGG